MPSTNGHGSKSNAGRVALYLRVSSDEQRERQTIETQRVFLGEYCRLYELEVAETYADDGVSGTIPLHERPDGRRLLEDAQAGRFETLLVYRLDRLGRSLLITVDAHDRLQAAEVSLRSATQPIDTSAPSGRLIFQMLASFAEYDRESIRERTRDGMYRAFREGKYMGRIPYGYCLDKDARLEVDEEEAPSSGRSSPTSRRAPRYTGRRSGSTPSAFPLRGGATEPASANRAGRGAPRASPTSCASPPTPASTG